MLCKKGFLRLGYGSKTHLDGSTYEGNFFNGEKSGFGVYTKVSGEKYEGEWKNDKRHGKGVEVYADSSSYKGGFIKDKKHGIGVYKKCDGYCYEGKWKAGKPHGNGKETFPDQTVYVGQFLDGKKHGLGKFFKINGYSYNGEFQFGKPHGRGVECFPDGTTQEGVFHEGHRRPSDPYAEDAPKDTLVSLEQIQKEVNGQCSRKECATNHLGNGMEPAVSASTTSKTLSPPSWSIPKQNSGRSLSTFQVQANPLRMNSIPSILRTPVLSFDAHCDSLRRVSSARKHLNGAVERN